mmetsp:Transcript_5271/g.13893  ORF Transcript_5271/g.13893 Transcript_5271/m.13893 type:complete len:256 (-) Transcript_5271:415-1182(-)
MSVPAECEERCLAHGRCIAWTLDKARHLCVLRLANTSLLQFSDDFVSARLSDYQIAERVRRLVRSGNTPAVAVRVDSPKMAGGSNESQVSATALGSNASQGAVQAVAGSVHGNTVSDSHDAHDAEEEGLEMHAEVGDGDPSDDGWSLRGLEEADALQRMYTGPGLRFEELDGERHVLDSVDFIGGDIQEVGGVWSVSDCQDACAAYVASPGCHAWTLSKQSGRCWLKHSNTTQQVVAKTAGLISGLMDSANKSIR